VAAKIRIIKMTNFVHRDLLSFRDLEARDSSRCGRSGS
jgi:hypothetical protein